MDIGCIKGESTDKDKPISEYENKQIPIDIFDSIEIDLMPVKPKKRRRIDDYDYDDPFFESFEGEFDAVELECKLENFFIHKGQMADDPKRIARKYNRTIQKKKNPPSDKQPNENDKFFDFEREVKEKINTDATYKKDVKFNNLILWILFTEEKVHNNPAEEHCNLNVFKQISDKKYEDLFNNFSIEKEKVDAFLNEQKEVIEKLFFSIQSTLKDTNNYDKEMKAFKGFKNDDFLSDIARFMSYYIRYYVCNKDMKFNKAKGHAMFYLNRAFPEQCTNKIKTKWFVSKLIETKINDEGYDLEQVYLGNFELKSGESDQNKSEEILKEIRSSPVKKGKKDSAIFMSQTLKSSSPVSKKTKTQPFESDIIKSKTTKSDKSCDDVSDESRKPVDSSVNQSLISFGNISNQGNSLLFTENGNELTFTESGQRKSENSDLLFLPSKDSEPKKDN